MAQGSKRELPWWLATVAAVLLVVPLVALGVSDHEAPNVEALIASGKTEFEGVTVEGNGDELRIRTSPTGEVIFFAVFGTAVIVVMGWLAVGLLRSPKLSLRHRLVAAPLLLLPTVGGAWFVWGKSVTSDEATIRVAERRMETRRSWLFGLVSSSQQASFEELGSLRIVWLPARSAAKMTALRLRFRDGSEQSLFRVLAQQRDLDAHGALRDHLAGALGVTVEPSEWRWWSW